MTGINAQSSEWYRQMVRIRLFEERALAEFSRGRLFGTTHTYIGQEADAVGILSAARRDDIVFSSHRGHGHYLAHGGNMRALAAELMGKATGVCGGRGGSQHLHFGSFYSNGVQGGIVPCATGMAFAEKAKKSGKRVIVFLGDGTLGEGVVYESLNLAALWQLPILFVLENNLYAQTTPIRLGVAGSICGRFEAFGIPATELHTTDVAAIYDAAAPILNTIELKQTPNALILNTFRFSAHSKGDDTRDPEEINARRVHDPLRVHGSRLDVGLRNEIETTCAAEVESAFETALNDPLPDAQQFAATAGKWLAA